MLTIGERWKRANEEAKPMGDDPLEQAIAKISGEIARSETRGEKLGPIKMFADAGDWVGELRVSLPKTCACHNPLEPFSAGQSFAVTHFQEGTFQGRFVRFCEMQRLECFFSVYKRPNRFDPREDDETVYDVYVRPK